MEHLWSLAVAVSGNRWQMQRGRKRLRRAKTVAAGCDRLPRKCDGKEGVGGSSVATVGQVQWELIEPLDEESVYARFLAEKGQGVHHVAVATPDFDETVAQADRRNGVILSGEFGDARVACLGTGPRSRRGHRIFSGTAAGGRPDESGP
jgi:hypothetical protein